MQTTPISPPFSVHARATIRQGHILRLAIGNYELVDPNPDRVHPIPTGHNTTIHDVDAVIVLAPGQNTGLCCREEKRPIPKVTERDPRTCPMSGDSLWTTTKTQRFDVVDAVEGWVIVNELDAQKMRAIRMDAWLTLVQGWFYYLSERNEVIRLIPIYNTTNESRSPS